MRQMRARAWAMRDGFADVLKGIGIAEEVRDFPVVEGGEVQAQPLTRAMLQQQAEEVDAQPADKGDDTGADTVTPDNPTAAEGRDDSDMGEGFNDDTPAWRGIVDAHLDSITKLETLIDVKGAVNQFRSEEHTSELQSLMRISYAVFCLKKKN